MAANCSATGCKTTVPPDLESESLCLLHFTVALEQDCARLRREATQVFASRERNAEILLAVAERGEKLARVATSGIHLTDEMKARILNTFLTLMNFRENFDRAANRQATTRIVR
jgi:hypothetical protein